MNKQEGGLKGIFVGQDRPYFFVVKCVMAILMAIFFLVNHDFARLFTNSPSHEILIMPVIFVNCERTALFPEKRDRDPIFTPNKQQRKVHKSCSILPD